MSTTRLSTPPRRSPAAAGLGLLGAVLLLALAVVAVHDLSVTQGWSSGSAWLAPTVEALDGVSPSVGLAVLGGVLAVLGLVVVLASLTRGRATHVHIDSGTEHVPAGSDLWLTPGAIGALAHELADRSVGVISTETVKTKRRRVVLRITDQQVDDQVRSDVQAGVDNEIGSLTPVKIVVRRAKPTTVKGASS